MRTTIVVCIVLLFQPLLARATKNPDDYPLQFSVVFSPGWSQNNGVYSGSGQGNLKQDETTRGVDFSYECDFQFGSGPSASVLPFRAKWSKPETRLKVLVGEIGSPGKYRECEIKTTVQDGVYVMSLGRAALVSQETYRNQGGAINGIASSPLGQPPSAAASPAISHPGYPLTVHLLDWTFTPVAMGNMGNFSGTGHGNTEENGSIHGFDYAYECGVSLQSTVGGQSFAGKWTKPGTRMTILVEVIGEKGKFQECQLKTTVLDGVYYKKLGNLTLASQGEFKQWSAEDQSRAARGDVMGLRSHVE